MRIAKTLLTILVLAAAACGEVTTVSMSPDGEDPGEDGGSSGAAGTTGAAGAGGSAGAAGSSAGGTAGSSPCPDGYEYRPVNGQFMCVPAEASAGTAGQSGGCEATVKIVTTLEDTSGAPLAYGAAGVGSIEFVVGGRVHSAAAPHDSTSLSFMAPISTVSAFGVDVSVLAWNGNHDRSVAAPTVTVRATCPGPSVVAAPIRFVGWPN